MSKQLFLTCHANLNQTDRENCEKRGVRAYKSSPFRLNLQIRSHTAKRGYYHTAELTADDCRALAAHLLEVADLIVEETPDHTHEQHVGRAE